MLKLLPLYYWYEYLDILYFFKANRGIINLNNDAQPNPHQPDCATRTVNPVTPRFWR